MSEQTNEDSSEQSSVEQMNGHPAEQRVLTADAYIDGTVAPALSLLIRGAATSMGMPPQVICIGFCRVLGRLMSHFISQGDLKTVLATRAEMKRQFDKELTSVLPTMGPPPTASTPPNLRAAS